MKGRALLLALLLLGSFPVLQANAGSTTHFGNSGSPASIMLDFNGPGHDASTNISIGASSVITTAALDIRGLANSSGERPESIGLDIGDDGDLDWFWGGLGNGTFGHLDEFSNGYKRAGLNMSTGNNSSYHIRLPINATITSASMQFSTLSELTISGSDVRDSHLHQPHPSYGNSTHADCNYGNQSTTFVGKTEWANWHIYRGVYWFDLGLLPGATVLDANLSFYVEDVVNQASTTTPVSAQHTYSVHPLLKHWEEGLEINAPVTQAAGVTWNKAIDNLTGSDYSWSSAGASGTTDRDAAVASYTDSPANLEFNWLDFNNQNLTDLVQDWVNGNVTNNGIILIGDENTNKPDGSRLTITSRDNSTHGPKLIVVFEGSDDVTAAFDVGADGNWEWNHSGNLSNASTVPDFSAALNSYLGNATPSFTDAWGNEFVDIPLKVSANATLVMDEVDIEYDWTAAVGPSPHSDLLSELNQHVSNLTPDGAGNVSIVINVSSSSAGKVELLNLWLGQGDRPPSISAITLPGETIVPDGMARTLSIDVISYQGVSNLSWLALIPQLQNSVSQPTLFHSLDNGTTWANDPAGLVSNISGSWVALDNQSGTMTWNLTASWAWLPEQGVAWQAQAMTIDSLHTSRLSSQTTDHERRMEITSFTVWDMSDPTDGSTQIDADEWVAGGDLLRVGGAVRFLDQSSHPLPGEVLIELVNITANATVDSNGAYSIDVIAPQTNYYDGFTIAAHLFGPYDSTEPGLASLTFNIDATKPGFQANAPLGERILPSSQQLFNVTITDGADSDGLDLGSLRLKWWVEALHDDGDGIPQIEEYGQRPLLREGESDYFHAQFDDTYNSHGQQVSLFIEGFDKTGNAVLSGPGLEADLVHYISLVPSPTEVISVEMDLPGGNTLTPAHPGWLNISMRDVNGLEDIESIIIDLGIGNALSYDKDGTFESNNPLIEVSGFTFEVQGDEIILNLSFIASPLFDDMSVGEMEITLSISDSSGEHITDTGLVWRFNADVMLVESSMRTVGTDSRLLVYDDYVILGQRLVVEGRIRYVAADLAPAPGSFSVMLEAPLDLPLLVATDADGRFEGNMDALGSGLYRVVIQVNGGLGYASPSPEPVRLQIDDEAPTVVGHEPTMISTNSTEMLLQFDIKEADSGLSEEEIQVRCVQVNGLQSFGDIIESTAIRTIPGEVSRYLVNLSSQPIQGEYLDCWFEVSDLAGNNLTGEGSAKTWPLRLEVIETRPDLSAERITMSDYSPVLGRMTTVSIEIFNIGTPDTSTFNITLETHTPHEGRILIEEVQIIQTSILNGDSTIVTFEWLPDWEGELDLVIQIDSGQDIDEIVEDNTVSLNVKVNPVPEPEGFFASQSMVSLIGMGLIGLVCIGLLFIVARRIGEGDDSEWLDEEEEEEY
ncbi:MAG: DNRLRE domain-containing protein [Candidatus Poseidoniaceae archaeon]|nr:DNRLRE domain-containing protein [Candidatus Poseidoniaceae archaeon]